MSLTRTLTIARRELSAYFSSPVAYVFIVVFLLLANFFTFMVGEFFPRGEASLTSSFFPWHPWLYLFLVPAVGMRLWAEERRMGTMELLFTMPLTLGEAVLGKFLAAWAVIGAALVLTFPLLLTVGYLGDPDWGVIASGYVGSFLMAGEILAITCLTSALTRNQVVSFIVSVVICLFFILAGFPPVTNFVAQTLPDAPWVGNLVSSLSVMTHYEGFQRGVLDTRDLVFFLSGTALALYLTSVALRAQRG